jgi:hypothetical protein
MSEAVPLPPNAFLSWKGKTLPFSSAENKNNRHFTLMPKDIYDIPLNSSWIEESFRLRFERKPQHFVSNTMFS